MEGLTRLRSSRRVYRSHVTRILTKVEETLAKEVDELARTYLRTAVTQLEKKHEQIIKLDQQIVELIQDPGELEETIMDSEEVQDLVMENINELNKRLEILSRPTPATGTGLTHQDLVDNDVISQEGSGDNVIPEATHGNVSTTTNTPQSIKTTISDTPVVCANTVTASNTIPITSLTLEPVVSSTSLTTTLLESVPPPISVSSASYPSVTYLHNLGPPPLIPASTDNSPLFPHLSTLNLGVSNSPSLTRVTSRISPSLMGPRTSTTTVDHNHSQQFAAIRLPKLTLPTFSGNS